jgi:hypothetical protein
MAIVPLYDTTYGAIPDTLSQDNSRQKDSTFSYNTYWNGTPTIKIDTGTVHSFNGIIHAYCPNTGESASYTVAGAVKRTSAGGVAFVGVPVVTAFEDDASWDVSAIVAPYKEQTTQSYGWSFLVTGAAGKLVHWTSQIEISVSYTQ